MIENDNLVLKECDRAELVRIIRERKIKDEKQSNFMKSVLAEASIY
jgi:hypothetical protein